MAPKTEGMSLSASETNLLVSIIRFKTGNIVVSKEVHLSGSTDLCHVY